MAGNATYFLWELAALNSVRARGFSSWEDLLVWLKKTVGDEEVDTNKACLVTCDKITEGRWKLSSSSKAKRSLNDLRAALEFLADLGLPKWIVNLAAASRTNEKIMGLFSSYLYTFLGPKAIGQEEDHLDEQSLREEVASLEAERDDLMLELDKTLSAAEESVKETQRLQQDLDDMNAKFASIEKDVARQLSEKDGVISKERSRAEELQLQLSQVVEREAVAGQTVQQALKSAEDALQQALDVQASLEAAESENDRLKEALEASKALDAELQKLLAQAQNAQAVSDELRKEAEADSDAALALVKEVEQSLDETQTELSSVMSQRQTWLEELEGMRAQMSRVLESESHIRKELELALPLVEESQQQLQNALQENAKLNVEIENARAELIAQKKELSDRIVQIESNTSAEALLGELRAELEKSKMETSQALSEKHEIRDRMLQREQVVMSLESKVRKLTQELETQAELVLSLKVEISGLQEAKTQVEASFESESQSHQSDLKALQDELQLLNDRIASLTQGLEEAKARAADAEALLEETRASSHESLVQLEKNFENMKRAKEELEESSKSQSEAQVLAVVSERFSKRVSELEKNLHATQTALAGNLEQMQSLSGQNQVLQGELDKALLCAEEGMQEILANQLKLDQVSIARDTAVQNCNVLQKQLQEMDRLLEANTALENELVTLQKQKEESHAEITQIKSELAEVKERMGMMQMAAEQATQQAEDLLTQLEAREMEMDKLREDHRPTFVEQDKVDVIVEEVGNVLNSPKVDGFDACSLFDTNAVAGNVLDSLTVVCAEKQKWDSATMLGAVSAMFQQHDHLWNFLCNVLLWSPNSQCCQFLWSLVRGSMSSREAEAQLWARGKLFQELGVHSNGNVYCVNATAAYTIVKRCFGDIPKLNLNFSDKHQPIEIHLLAVRVAAKYLSGQLVQEVKKFDEVAAEVVTIPAGNIVVVEIPQDPPASRIIEVEAAKPKHAEQQLSRTSQLSVIETDLATIGSEDHEFSDAVINSALQDAMPKIPNVVDWTCPVVDADFMSSCLVDALASKKSSISSLDALVSFVATYCNQICQGTDHSLKQEFERFVVRRLISVLQQVQTCFVTKQSPYFEVELFPSPEGSGSDRVRLGQEDEAQATTHLKDWVRFVLQLLENPQG